MTPSEISEMQAVIRSEFALARKSAVLTVDVAPVPVAPAVKPAWQTTEFWGHVAVALLGLLATSGVIIPGSELAKVIGLITVALSGLGYSVSRGLTKLSLKK